MKRASFWLPVALILLFGFVIVSCSKSNASSKPQLSIKSINTVVPFNGTLDVVLQFTDKKEDLSGGYFFALRNRLNMDIIPPTSGNNDTFSGVIPTFPSSVKGQFEFMADYQSLQQSSPTNQNEPDTLIFMFAAMTKDSVWSDTIKSPQIIIQH